jgi:hypothetical protein
MRSDRFVSASQAELSGDVDGIANHRRVLALVIALEERRVATEERAPGARRSNGRGG